MASSTPSRLFTLVALATMVVALASAASASAESQCDMELSIGAVGVEGSGNVFNASIAGDTALGVFESQNYVVAFQPRHAWAHLY